jgi:hypothetical protein
MYYVSVGFRIWVRHVILATVIPSNNRLHVKRTPVPLTPVVAQTAAVGSIIDKVPAPSLRHYHHTPKSQRLPCFNCTPISARRQHRLHSVLTAQFQPICRQHHLRPQCLPPQCQARTSPTAYLTCALVSAFHIASQHRIFTDRISYPSQAIALLALSKSPCPLHL